MTPLPKSCLLKRNRMNKNQDKHFKTPVETKIMEMHMYQFRLTKNLFLSGVYEHLFSLAE